jgi:hypothetical protein
LTAVERIEKVLVVAVAKLQKRFGKEGFLKRPGFAAAAAAAAAAGVELASGVALHMARVCSCKKPNLL